LSSCGYTDLMRSIDDDFRDAIAPELLDRDAIERLEHAARALANTPRWMASSITASRSVRPERRAAFRAAASYVARRYGLHVTIEEDRLVNACFFRPDEDPR